MALLPVSDALTRILNGLPDPDIETISVWDGNGRALAEDLIARLTQPPFAASAMDGYAVSGADIAENAHARLSVIGVSQAGSGFSGTVERGSCVRIFTGAPMPRGADTVVIQENVSVDHDTIVISDAPAPGANVRGRGIDFGEGDPVLRRGYVLEARSLTLAAAAGHGSLQVGRRPRVAILATGDELVPPGTEPGPDQIVSSNPVGLAAVVADAGGVPISLGIGADNRDEIASKIKAGLEADVLVTIGGASVGDHDLIGPVLKDLGIELAFWKVAVRPGKPMLFGRLDQTRVMGLPGNPVSSLICARVFLAPLIRALAGASAIPPRLVPARLASGLGRNGPRLHLMRGRIVRDASGDLTVMPSSTQDSSVLSEFAAADCLIWREPEAPALTAGSTVHVELLA